MDSDDRSSGYRVPPSRLGKKGLTVYADAALLHRLRVFAAMTGRSMQDLVTEAIAEHLDNHGAPVPPPAPKSKE